ncbi:MAG: hypothetical protein ACI376_07320 [Candidatus Bruticola sp.]
MSELSRIETARKIACPHCRALLDDEHLTRALENESISCPYCGSSIKLPDEMKARYLRSKYVGRNLDITC